jgi:hypothetical protein
MTSNRLLSDKFFKHRVDGWLSLSGGRLGPTEIPEAFFRGRPRPPMPAGGDAPRPGRAAMPDCDISFIFASGEHEMVALPETSPWADKYHAGPRMRLDDVIDTEPGLVYDGRNVEGSTPAWGKLPRPGTARVYVYPNADGGRVIADVVRLAKGHTEGLEPNVTEALIKLIVSAPGGKAKSLHV